MSPEESQVYSKESQPEITTPLPGEESLNKLPDTNVNKHATPPGSAIFLPSSFYTHMTPLGSYALIPNHNQ
jgi:hypothetical protein